MTYERTIRGMLIAIDASGWEALDAQTPMTLGQALRETTGHLDPRTVRKHPRGPKSQKPKDQAARATVERHVATARVLKDGGIC
jgi:hypothetical protein